MRGFMRGYVRRVDAFNRGLGRLMMYGIFVMIGILMWSSISKLTETPSLWTLQMAQFAMVAYYMLGGPYSIQMGSNVRMDLFYANWTPRQKAQVDAFTVLFLITYLVILLWGGLSSLAYALGEFRGEIWSFYGRLIGAFVTGGPEAASEVMGVLERSAKAWRAYMWPIKLIMCVGIFLMLLQAISEFFKDLLRLKGEEA